MENQKFHPNTCQQKEIRGQSLDLAAGGLSFELSSCAQGRLPGCVTCAVGGVKQRQNLGIFEGGAEELLTDRCGL